MAGNPHPVFQDGVPVEKANARAYLPLRLGNPDALRNLDGSTFWLCYIQTLLSFFYRDTSDTTSADNGTSVIVDGGGYIWKVISSGAGIAINAAGPVADRGDFDSEDPGFTYFGTDTELLYVRLTGGGWSDGSTIVGPEGPISTVPGPANSLEIGTVTEGPAAATITGTAPSQTLNLTLPKGDDGDQGPAFSPNEVVPDLAGRATYDASAKNFAVLVESDSSNSDLPTLYFKLSATSGDWSVGFTFEGSGGGSTSDFENRAAVEAAAIPGDLNFIRTAGYTDAGDEGDALYKRAASEPTHAGKIQSADGAWWEIVPQNGELNVRQFGAHPSQTEAVNTAAIQLALRCAEAIGCGEVVLPFGVYEVGKTSTETYQTFAQPTGHKDQYAILVPTGVTLRGRGKGSVLKRSIEDSLVIVLLANTEAAQVRNLTVDGNNTDFPIEDTPTFGSGAGVFVESGVGTEDKENIIDTVWVKDTPGYGVGVEWGNHRGLTLKNIFIDGTGSDGIDIKRMNSEVGVSSFDGYGIVMDNIHVTNFGRTATDTALQTGVDIRGWVTASNIHIYGAWGEKAQSGIRIREGILSDNAIGGDQSSVTNYIVHRDSGGATTTFGVEINGNDCSTANGTVQGTTYGVGHQRAGNSTDHRRVQHANVQAIGCTYGFWTSSTSFDVIFTGCSALLCTTRGYLIAGTRSMMICPMVRQDTSGNRIELVSGAASCQIVAPAFSGNSTDPSILDAGTSTRVLDSNNVNYGFVNTTRLTISGTAQYLSGAGTPEGAVSAPVGSIYTRTDGSTSTTLYVKTSGTGNTGWTAK